MLRRNFSAFSPLEQTIFYFCDRVRRKVQATSDIGMQNKDIYTVSRLNSEVRMVLEQQFQRIWLQGEVSNFVAAASGHWYFSLKDSGAQVKVAMFRQSNRMASIKPQNGQQVLIKARISVYEPRGEYQLLAELLEDAGSGALQLQFEQVKARLLAEGFLASERKRPLPAMIQRLGVVTSPTGAAIRDILTVLKRRAPGMQVIIYPSLVQGASAAGQLCQALSLAYQRNEVDAIIIGRGGGSLEDLWCFNDEQLARLVAKSPVPIVSAVGHEIDVTISDFVADIRAATPSAAAELVSSDQLHLLERLQRLQRALVQAQRQQLQRFAPKVAQLAQRLQARHPSRQLQQQQQRLDELGSQLLRRLQQRLQQLALQQASLSRQLSALSPAKKLQQHQQQLAQQQRLLGRAMQQRLQQQQQRWQLLLARLDTVSPLATLARGYSISFDEQNQVITNSAALEKGQLVHTKLAQGSFVARVTATER
ncbi:Exodeoxyribonuclease VII large subunit [Alkalimonas amylolytica]|uniref:Exodeoxyribonuclease 7 large subunit n=2 Tax=Alkalimonas amylolytica TaxID=152573 RepID=A0A1H3X3K8_ALKAM|nr:Exodeoxyribonuclease VII large subunit [Alkalimonas amylolytica]